MRVLGLKAERIQTCLQWCLRDQVGWYGYYIQDIRVNFLAIHIHIYIYPFKVVRDVACT